MSVAAVPELDPGSARTGRGGARPIRLFVLALLAGLLSVTAYVLFVRTFPGQRLDDLAFEGRKSTYLSARRTGAFLVRHLTVPAVVAGAITVLVMTARRRNWVAGIVALGCVPATVLAARALKALLPRPEISELANATYENTFPSGHSAAIMASVLAILSAGDDRFRRRAMPVAVVAVVGYSAAMVSSGWHRSSDVGGGLLLALVVVATATGFRVLREDPMEPAPLGWKAVDLGRLVLAVSLVLAVLVMTVNNPPADPRYSLLLYVVSVVAAAVVGTLGVVGFVAAMHSASVSGVKGTGKGQK